MLDTGAGDSTADLNRPFVDAHRLLEAVTGAADVARPAAIGGPAAFVYGTGRRLSIGSLTFDMPRLGLSRATGGSSASAARDGIIGNAILERFVVHLRLSDAEGVLRAIRQKGRKRQRRVPTMARSCRRRASSCSGVVFAYFGGSNRRLDASNTASNSMYSSSSSSRLGK